MLSHANLAAVLAQLFVAISQYNYRRDILLAVVPFYHIYGSSVIALLAWLKGVPIVILPRFEPRTFLAAIETHKVTVRHLCSEPNMVHN